MKNHSIRIMFYLAVIISSLDFYLRESFAGFMTGILLLIGGTILICEVLMDFIKTRRVLYQNVTE